MSLLMDALRKAERARHQPEINGHAEAQAPFDLGQISLEEIEQDETPVPEPAPEVSPARERPTIAQPPPVRQHDRSESIHVPAPRTIRVVALLGLLFAVLAAFGYLYWRAVYGPGSSRHLPMVPMPGLAGTAASYVPEAAVPTPATLAPSPPLALAPAAVPAPATVIPTPAPPPPVSATQMHNLTPEEYARMDRQAATKADAQAQAANSQAARTPAAATAEAAPVPSTPAAPAPAASWSTVAAPAQHARAPRSAVPPASTDTAAHAAPRIAPGLQAAWDAYQRGDLADARSRYDAVLRTEPHNRDALLGSAAVAARSQQPAAASAIYQQLLEGDPADPDALAGMASLRGSDTNQSEARLRRALAESPDSSAAQFALGNLYAAKGRWSEAQQQFFKAYNAAPDNADYAFSLAIGLDHLNQPRLARGYYERALQLAENRSPHFDREAAARRVRELQGQ